MRTLTLKDKAYKYIKDKIISGEYLPGDFLDEKKLIEEINSSRTPIREALNKIEQENLIKIIPKKVVIVTEISLKDILDIYQIRDLVEPNAVIIYGSSYDKKILEEFKASFSKEELEPLDFFNQDDSFHAFLTEPFKNRYIDAIMEDVRVQNKRLRILTGSFEFKLAANEHINIIDCLLKEDYKSASEALREHLLQAKERTLNYYSEK